LQAALALLYSSSSFPTCPWGTELSNSVRSLQFSPKSLPHFSIAHSENAYCYEISKEQITRSLERNRETWSSILRSRERSFVPDRERERSGNILV
jgi:hypothetical protein